MHKARYMDTRLGYILFSACWLGCAVQGTRQSGSEVVTETPAQPTPPEPPSTSSFVRPPAEEVSANCGEPVDVVFSIDVSTSMDAEISAIRNGIAEIWNTADALSADPQFRLVVFVDAEQVTNGCQPFASATALQAELDRWYGFSQASNRQPDNSGVLNTDCAENSMDALYAAATACSWREDATRIVIHVTDDTFQVAPGSLGGGGHFGPGVTIEHSYAQVAAALQQQGVRLGAFAQDNTARTYCNIQVSPQDVGVGFFRDYGAQPSLVSATEGKAWDLNAVRSGSLSMTTAITSFVKQAHCGLI